MDLSREHFGQFFADVNSGHVPFAWQERLVDYLYSAGRWPSAIVAPTGTGKSVVVDVHVFMSALHAAGQGPRLPRRLSAVVGRRALVDAQADRARRIQQYLDTRPSELAAVMRELLLSLSGNVQNAQPLVLSHLRGGLAPDRGWIDEPTSCAIICATPDMWGSRLLMRGYGSSRRARPREAGLLAYDSVVVLDEAHLTRQLAATARRISDLATSHATALGVPGLQVVETTATLPQAISQGAVGVQPSDLEGSHANRLLVNRMTRAKPVRYVESPHWVSHSTAYIAALTEQAQALASQAPDGAIVCVVNQVRTAIQLADSLGHGTPCWVGRMRPLDLEELKVEYAHLLGNSAEADPHTPRFLVATQTIEVGVDADFAGMLTEIAPGDALAQRSGRVNRHGLLENAPVIVIGPPQAVLDSAATGNPGRAIEQAALPYAPADLAAARMWLETLEPGLGITPQAVTASPPPTKTPERLLPSLPQPYDVQRWVVTSDQSLTDEELELWIRDSLKPDDLMAGIVLRASLPRDDGDAVALLAATPPDDREVFPTALHLVRDHLKRILSAKDLARAFLYRDNSVAILPANSDEASHGIKPGDVVILDASHPVANHGVVVEASLASSLIPRTVWGAAGVEVVLPGSADSGLLEDLVDLDPEEAQLLFEASGRGEQLTLPPPDPDRVLLPWLVLRPPQLVGADESVIQEWTTSQAPISLGDHQRAVSDRVGEHAAHLGLDDQLARAMIVAGAHHDDGKVDRRFQVERLGNSGEQPLAKSRLVSSQESRRRRWRSLLPPGYRHELASVVRVWDDLAKSETGRLALRLIGTSHGHARGLPPNDSQGLFADHDAGLRDLATNIFQGGEWNALLEETDWRFGPWVCCYLEALLRAADCQVSREGS